VTRHIACSRRCPPRRPRRCSVLATTSPTYHTVRVRFTRVSTTVQCVHMHDDDDDDDDDARILRGKRGLSLISQCGGMPLAQPRPRLSIMATTTTAQFTHEAHFCLRVRRFVYVCTPPTCLRARNAAAAQQWGGCARNVVVYGAWDARRDEVLWTARKRLPAKYINPTTRPYYKMDPAKKDDPWVRAALSGSTQYTLHAAYVSCPPHSTHTQLRHIHDNTGT